MRFQILPMASRPSRYAVPLAAMLFSMAMCTAQAASEGIRIPMKKVTADGIGANIGEVRVSDTPHGALFTPALEGLPPGLHGFHLHEKPDCAPAPKDGKPSAAAAAGGHYDPDDSGRHGAPWDEGHRGDLPALYVDASGRATQPVLAPRLKVREVGGRALMIHAGGDNHSDHPKPLGGGAGRIACGAAG